MEKRSILIGCNGYLGRHMSFFLKSLKIYNLNLDIHNDALSGISNYTKFDITQKAEFEKLDPKIDFIFLFAGLTGTERGFSDYEDFIKVNELGLLNLVTWMHMNDCKARIIYPSTRLVYKGTNKKRLAENDEKEAKTIYALNKLAAENILLLYNNLYGINYTIFRICVPYGNLFDQKRSYGTLGLFINMAIDKKEIVIYGDGKLGRTFTHVEDICKLILQSIDREDTNNEIFNIGGEELNLLEVATIVADKYNVKVKFNSWPEMSLKLETGDTIFDDSKLKNKINYIYTKSIKNEL
jgi:UDP-glucose 4-epimerase